MEPVLRDLRGSGITPPRIEDSDWTKDPQMPSVMLWHSDGSGVQLSVDRLAPEWARVAMVADQLQEWVIEDCWASGAPTNWPQCPHHPDTHPLRASADDDAAMWRCPADGTPISPIGAIEPPRETPPCSTDPSSN